MALNYNTYVTAISTLLVIPESNSEFQTILPSCIDYSEQRIYRELNLLSTVVRDASASLAPGSRDFTIPANGNSGPFVVVNALNIVTPANTQPDDGTRKPLTPVSLNYLDMAWPSASGTGEPTYFAMASQTAVVVGPWPNDSYVVEVIGTTRPTPLSSSNPNTFLTDNLPDLFTAASMIFMAGYIRNFGSQSDDPKMAASWSSQYEVLKASADTEEARKRFMGSAWSAMTQGPAQPARN